MFIFVSESPDQLLVHRLPLLSAHQEYASPHAFLVLLLQEVVHESLEPVHLHWLLHQFLSDGPSLLIVYELVNKRCLILLVGVVTFIRRFELDVL